MCRNGATISLQYITTKGLRRPAGPPRGPYAPLLPFEPALAVEWEDTNTGITSIGANTRLLTGTPGGVATAATSVPTLSQRAALLLALTALLWLRRENA